MGLNDWLRDQSPLVQAAVGALVIGVVYFVLNYSEEPIGATIVAVIVGLIGGLAYYLGMRVGTTIRD